MCNLLIKFGAFNEKHGHEFDKIATGHYATNYTTDEGSFLSTAADKIKDQTYFLGQITYDQLKKSMFPIGHLPKSEVRKLAIKMKLPSAHRKDSQGICFLGKINYSEFIRAQVGTLTGEIRELETDLILGEHDGFWFHTIGQRRGLRLSGGPWFVVKKDIEKNIVYVSKGYDPVSRYRNNIYLDPVHFLNPNHDYVNLKSIKFKIRHQPEYNDGTIVFNNSYNQILSETGISGIAPGQYCVLYSEDERTCIGSAMISERNN